ncbi:MAG: tetratricopeptide repeat protein [Prosthecobacter sp.]|nr:tetratricopeptide repeat protein [Prosthecobacter sp.]
MPDEIQFRFSIQGLPDGEALTGLEIEQKFLETLDLKEGKCSDTLWGLAVLYQQTGHLDQAIGCIQRVIDLSDDPEKIGSGYLALGQLEESRGDYTAAIKQYGKALSLEPCSQETWYFIHNNLGYSLNQLNKHDSAVPYLERALEIDPARPNAYKNLGLAQEALGELAKAAELFILATRVDAADSRSLNHLLAMMESNPALEVDIPDLRTRVEACQMAVEAAKSQQPDFKAHWASLREKQRPKWWQFWKRRPLTNRNLQDVAPNT